MHHHDRVMIESGTETEIHLKITYADQQLTQSYKRMIVANLFFFFENIPTTISSILLLLHMLLPLSVRSAFYIFFFTSFGMSFVKFNFFKHM